MRTYFAYKKLILHLPESPQLSHLFITELDAAGVTIGVSKDSLSYRSVMFPKGQEVLAAKAMEALIGRETPCRLEILGGYCGSASEMCTLATFSDVVYKLTETPDHQFIVHQLLHQRKDEHSFQIIKSKLTQTLVMRRAIESYLEEITQAANSRIDGVSHADAIKEGNDMLTHLKDHQVFYLRYSEELDSDIQYYRDFFKELADDYGQQLVNDTCKRIEDEDLEVIWRAPYEDQESEYREFVNREEELIEDIVTVTSHLFMQYGMPPIKPIGHSDDDDDDDSDSWKHGG